MANIVYTDFIYNFVSQSLNIVEKNLRIALFNAGYSPDPDHTTYSEIINNEIDGNGYIAGGNPLTGVAIVKDNENNVVKIVADDVSWESASITCRYAVVYVEDGEELVACFDFGTDKTSLNGAFIIEWSEDGMLQLGGSLATFSVN
jgi:hypothetical protein